MIIFTSKAYNIVPLVPHAKAALTNETVGVAILLPLWLRHTEMYIF